MRVPQTFAVLVFLANGSNRSAFSFTTFLTGTTLAVGEKTLVQNGALAP